MGVYAPGCRIGISVYLEDTVHGLDSRILVGVEHTEHRCVLEEIDGAHFHAQDFQAETLFKVGHEVVIAVRGDEFDIIVLDILAALAVVLGQYVLGHPYDANEDGADDADVDNADEKGVAR